MKISISLRNDTVNNLDYIADNLGLNRSSCIAMLVNQSYLQMKSDENNLAKMLKKINMKGDE